MTHTLKPFALTRKKKKKKKPLQQMLLSALFEGAGMARRIAFAIDISGSMSGERIDVVKKHLRTALRSMQGPPTAHRMHRRPDCGL